MEIFNISHSHVPSAAATVQNCTAKKSGLEAQIAKIMGEKLGKENDPYALDVKIGQSTHAQGPMKRTTDSGCRQTDSSCYGTQSGCYSTDSGCYSTQRGC